MGQTGPLRKPLLIILPVKETSVDYLAHSDCMINDFHHPADEGIFKKIPEDLIDRHSE